LSISNGTVVRPVGEAVGEVVVGLLVIVGVGDCVGEGLGKPIATWVDMTVGVVKVSPDVAQKPFGA